MFKRKGQSREDGDSGVDLLALDNMAASFRDLSETLDDQDEQAILVNELCAVIEDDARRFEITELDEGWILIHWWPSYLRAELLVSPVFAGADGARYVKLLLNVPIGNAPDRDSGQMYAFQHNLQAATLYHWVVLDGDEIACRTVVVLDPDDDSSLATARAILWETYASAAGKAASITLDGKQEGYVPADIHKPDALPVDDLREARAVMYENVRLREVGEKGTNTWANLRPGWVGQWVQGKFSPVLGTIAAEMPKGNFWASFPILTLLLSSPEEKINATAVLTVTPDEHPYIGPGLRVTLELSNIFANVYEAIRACNVLNLEEYDTANYPMMTTGAWMVDPRSVSQSGAKPRIAYTSFYASGHGRNVDLDDVCWQMVIRAHRTTALLGPSTLDDSHVTTVVEPSSEMTVSVESGVETPLVTVGINLDPDSIHDGGDGWVQLRNAMQSRLSLDEQWCLDTPEHLWWWGTPFPVEVGTELIAPLEGDNVARRLVRVVTRIGFLTDSAPIPEVHKRLMRWNLSRPGCTALLEERDDVTELVLTHTVPVSTNISHPARAVTGAMALQSAYGLDLYKQISSDSALEPFLIAHPTSGARTDADEIATMFHPENPNPPHFDVVHYLDAEVREAYEEMMEDTGGLDRGWSNVEAVYFQLKSDPRVGIGMGVLAAAESPFGAGVRYSVTIPLVAPIDDPSTAADLANVLNHGLAHAAETGHWVCHIGSVCAIPTDRGVYQFALEGFVPADVLHEYNTEEASVEQRAGVLAHWAFVLLGQGVFLAGMVDAGDLIE